MTDNAVSRIHHTFSRLTDPADIAELSKMAKSDAIAAALSGDPQRTMERSAIIAEAADSRLAELDLASLAPGGSAALA